MRFAGLRETGGITQLRTHSVRDAVFGRVERAGSFSPAFRHRRLAKLARGRKYWKGLSQRNRQPHQKNSQCLDSHRGSASRWDIEGYFPGWFQWCLIFDFRKYWTVFDQSLDATTHLYNRSVTLRSLVRSKDQFCLWKTVMRFWMKRKNDTTSDDVPSRYLFCQSYLEMTRSQGTRSH